jgi:hypothetical protein
MKRLYTLPILIALVTSTAFVFNANSPAQAKPLSAKPMAKCQLDVDCIFLLDYDSPKVVLGEQVSFAVCIAKDGKFKLEFQSSWPGKGYAKWFVSATSSSKFDLDACNSDKPYFINFIFKASKKTTSVGRVEYRIRDGKNLLLGKWVGVSYATRAEALLDNRPTAAELSAPTAPSLLVATAKSPFDGTGTLTWTDNSNNEDNFYISNVDPAGLTGLPLSSIWYRADKNQTSASITGYRNGYTYCYWGMASNTIGNSAWSGPVCSVAGTATTTTTAYVPPTNAYVPPTTAYVPSYGGGGGGSSSNWLGCYFKGKKMWGNVYIASSSWSADFDVYVTSSSWSADLRVYQPSSSWSANSCGHWYITTSSWNADFSVYLTSSSWSSDFSIYLTTSSWNAGR